MNLELSETIKYGVVEINIKYFMWKYGWDGAEKENQISSFNSNKIDPEP